MFNKVEYQVGWDADKPVNRVVYYFLFVQFFIKCAKMLNKGKTLVVHLLIYVNPFNNP